MSTRKLKFSVFAVCAGLILGAEGASAGIVYDNGGPNADSGNEVTQWLQAEDFSLASPAAITDAHVFIAGLGNISAWDGTVDYFFFADDSGSPGSQLAAGSGQNIATSDTGMAWPFGGNAFEIGFDLETAFNAAAGTVYWFGIHLSSDFVEDDIFWVTTDHIIGNGHESLFGTQDNWSNNENEHAFYLTDDAAPVPAPGTLALFGIGLAGLGLARRHRMVA